MGMLNVVRYLTGEDIAKLNAITEGFRDCEYEPSVIIAAETAVRPGEDFFLRWEDIDWSTGTVNVTGTLLEYPAGYMVERPLKPEFGLRVTKMSSDGLKRLEEIWVERGRPQGRIIGDARPTSVHRALRKWVKGHDIEWPGLKGLRHIHLKNLFKGAASA